MKQLLNILLIFAIISISKNVIGQKDSINQPPSEIITYYEELPSYPGGDEARIKYLQEHIKLPENFKTDSIYGIVFVQFLVESNGNISHAKVLKGINPTIDSIALNAIYDMPKWVPAKQRGKPVDCSFNLPIRFGKQIQIKKRKNGA